MLLTDLGCGGMGEDRDDRPAIRLPIDEAMVRYWSIGVASWEGKIDTEANES